MMMISPSNKNGPRGELHYPVDIGGVELGDELLYPDYPVARRAASYKRRRTEKPLLPPRTSNVNVSSFV